MKKLIISLLNWGIARCTPHEWVKQPYTPNELRAESSLGMSSGWQRPSIVRFKCSKCGVTACTPRWSHNLEKEHKYGCRSGL